MSISSLFRSRWTDSAWPTRHCRSRAFYSVKLGLIQCIQLLRRTLFPTVLPTNFPQHKNQKDKPQIPERSHSQQKWCSPELPQSSSVPCATCFPRCSVNAFPDSHVRSLYAAVQAPHSYYPQLLLAPATFSVWLFCWHVQHIALFFQLL